MKLLKSEDLSTLKKLKKYIKRYYFLIIFNMLLSMVSSAVSVSPLVLVQRLVDQGILGSNQKDIIYASGGMICLAVVGAVLIYWNGILSGFFVGLARLNRLALDQWQAESIVLSEYANKNLLLNIQHLLF